MRVEYHGRVRCTCTKCGHKFQEPYRGYVQMDVTNVTEVKNREILYLLKEIKQILKSRTKIIREWK